MKRLFAALLALTLVGARTAEDPSDWYAPTPPFRIVGNIYYVGTKGLAAYLIATPRGLILLDGTAAENAPLIERNIAGLGFRVRDVRILLNTHAHFDHAGALAALKRDSHAEFLASPGDAPALEAGRPSSDTTYGVRTFPPVKVDALLDDGRPVRLGVVALTPIFTPGHTPGCTSWRMTVADRGRALRVLFPCSLAVAGNVLVGNRGYPAIVADFRRSFALIGAMRADIVLPAHPDLVDIAGRRARQAAGGKDAFLMPGLLANLRGHAVRDFDAELAKQRAAARDRPAG